MTRPTRLALADRAEWRLAEHFFRALFDFGILSTAGADSFKHMLLGAVGAFFALGFLLTRIYAGKYAALSAAASPEPYRRAVFGDDLFLVGFPMLLVAFVTLLVSHSLFPDERDFRILGPLPVQRPVVFGAKLAALLLFTGSCIGVAHVSLVPLMLLTSMNRFAEHAVLSRATAWALASVSASLFAVLAVTAAVGVLMLAASRSRWYALTAAIRSFMLALLVVCVPFVFHLPSVGASLGSRSGWLMLLPPAWFVGVERVLLGNSEPRFMYLAGIALAAAGTAAVIVAVVYLLLFRHFERLVLRPAAASLPAWNTARAAAFTGGTPAFGAIHRFITATIGRSQLHQGVLVGLASCGVSIALSRLVGSDLVGALGASGARRSLLASAAVWAPFALMFVCGLSVRATLALPMEYRANWIFRLTEDEATRREQLRAVDQLVTTWLVGVPVATAIPVLWIAVGPGAVVATAVVALVGLVFVHAVLLDWHRIPFTCSYLPGKRLLAHTLVLGFTAFVLFTRAGVGLVSAATASGTYAVAIITTLSVIAWLLRRRRLASWQETPLQFEDEFPDQPLQLGL